MQSTVNDEEFGFHEGIDKGDVTALGAFADWLQERDDPRATGYRFLRDKKKVPKLPTNIRAPWLFGATTDLQEEINKLGTEKQLACRVSCVLAALHDAESVLHLFEDSFPNDRRPRQAIEAVKQWIVSPIQEAIAAVNAAVGAATQVLCEIEDESEGARKVAALSSVLDAAHTQ
jgi:uncharacterized protein (TIGR02996 family)